MDQNQKHTDENGDAIVFSPFTPADMFQYIDEIGPTSIITLSNQEAELVDRFLVKLDRAEVDENNNLYVKIDPDLFLAGLTVFPNCQINLTYDGDQSTEKAPFRVVVLPDYQDAIQGSDNGSALVAFVYDLDIIVPVFIDVNEEIVGLGNAFTRDGREIPYNFSLNLDHNGAIINVTVHDIFYSLLTLWYGVQITKIDPQTKDLFIQKDPAPNFYTIDSDKLNHLLYDDQKEG